MNREQQVKKLESEWQDSPRWSGIKRDYSAEDVVRLPCPVAFRQHPVIRRGELGPKERSTDQDEHGDDGDRHRCRALHHGPSEAGQAAVRRIDDSGTVCRYEQRGCVGPVRKRL